MTRIGWIAVLAFAFGCGSKGSDVVGKLAELEKAMCACADEACAKQVREQHDKYLAGGKMKEPSDEQMKSVMATERKIDACEAKFVMGEAATMSLDALRTGLATAKEKIAAGKYTEAAFACSQSDAERFQKTYGAITESKPEIKKFLDEYTAYCKEGMHLEAATSLVTKAEASRTATPEGSIPECGSPDLTLAEVKLKDVASAAAKLAPLKERYAKACGR